MKTRGIALVTAIAVALTLAASTAEAGKGKKKKKKPVGGVVTAVVSKENGEGTLSVKVGARKKKAGPPSTESSEKKFSLTKETKFERLTGKKKSGETKPATVKDVTKSARVSIVADKGDVVEKVTIMAGKKKAKG